MILIQFPLHHSNISAKGNLSFLCLQVKQDLRGRDGDCQAYLPLFLSIFAQQFHKYSNPPGEIYIANSIPSQMVWVIAFPGNS